MEKKYRIKITLVCDGTEIMELSQPKGLYSRSEANKYLTACEDRMLD